MPSGNNDMTAATTPQSGSANFALTIIILLMLSLTACGGGGGGGTVTGASIPPPAAADNYLTITDDEYGLVTPNFYYSTDNSAFWSIQADVAKDVTDQDFACVVRIDIQKSGSGAISGLSGKTFSIEEGGAYDKFPGNIFVSDGHKSTKKSVEHGIISFAPVSASPDDIKGEFDVTMTDYDSKIVPPPQYRLKGKFGFKMGTYGAATPLPPEVYPAKGRDAYDQLCSGCHKLGDYDTTGETASDLSQRGGELPMVYPGDVREHRGIILDQQTMANLRIFLNAE